MRGYTFLTTVATLTVLWLLAFWWGILSPLRIVLASGTTTDGKAFTGVPVLVGYDIPRFVLACAVSLTIGLVVGKGLLDVVTPLGAFARRWLGPLVRWLTHAPATSTSASVSEEDISLRTAQ